MKSLMLKRLSRLTLAAVSGFAALAALLLPVSAFAQQAEPWKKIPIPALPAFHPHEPVRIELKNGIVLFLQADHELPFISGSVTIPGGSRNEREDKAGLIDLYGMTWRTSGSEKMSGDQMDDILAQKAAHIETGGDIDSTALSWNSLKADSDQVYALAMDLLFHPKFSQAKLQLAKQQEATGIVRRNDDEGQIASREADKLVYGVNSPYTRQPEISTLSNISLADLEQLHDRSLRGRFIVSVSGDFDPAAMEARLRSTFGGLPQVTALSPRHDTFPGPKPGVYFINKSGVNQSNIEIVGLGTTRNNPDVASLAVMNDILGGGFGSRLFQTVRTRLGLAYEVGGGLGFGYDHPASFRVVALTKSPTTVEATKAALAEISGLTSQPFTPAELKRGKDDLLNGFLFRYDTRDKVLAERVLLEFYGYPPDYLDTYKAGIEKVTIPDLEEVAKKYIHPGKLAILVVGNGPKIKPGLEALGMGPIHPIDITIPMPKREEHHAPAEKKP